MLCICKNKNIIIGDTTPSPRIERIKEAHTSYLSILTLPKVS